MSAKMPEQRLIPTSEELTDIIRKTRDLLEFLRDAALIESDKVPRVPESTIAYRKGQAVHRWLEWEQVLNPSRVPFDGPPFGMAAGGWRNWHPLHLALVDLYALRHQIIAHWDLAPLIRAESIRLGFEAIGKPGSGEKALFLQTDTLPTINNPTRIRIEKPIDWPPPLPLDWYKQCRYVVQRIRKVMEAEVEKAAPPSANPDVQQTSDPSAKPAMTSANLRVRESQSEGSSERWTAGTFLAKARELSRRLRSWHIDDFRSPVQFVSEQESRRVVRLTFRDITAGYREQTTSRPQKSLQMYPNEDGKPDEHGFVGEIYENPERDTDRYLTLWLLGDFRRHLDLTCPSGKCVKSSPPMPGRGLG